MRIYKSVVLTKEVLIESRCFRRKHNANAALGFTMCLIKDEISLVKEWQIQYAHVNLIKWLFL